MNPSFPDPTRATRSQGAKSRSKGAAGPRVISVGLAAAITLLAGCSGGGDDPVPAAPAPPEGTVISIDQVHLTADDIDRWLPAIELIDPHLVKASQRRRAFSNIVLPLAAGAALDPASRDEAFGRAQSILATTRETGTVPEGTPEPQVLTGTFVEVGLAPWAMALEMQIPSYSELFETPGAWTFFKLIASNAEPGQFDGRTELTIVRYDIPYLPREATRTVVYEGMEQLPIRAYDPDWEAIIPPVYLYNKASRAPE